jgi:hypothetical protein
MSLLFAARRLAALSPRSVLAALLTLTLLACASTPPPQYPADNPASPSAATAPPAPPSQTLKSYRSALPATRAPFEPKPSGTNSGDSHAGHQMPQEDGRE